MPRQVVGQQVSFLGKIMGALEIAFVGGVFGLLHEGVNLLQGGLLAGIQLATDDFLQVGIGRSQELSGVQARVRDLVRSHGG